MNTPSVKSLRALCNLKITLKKPDDRVRVMKAGSHYRARFHGQANCVFGLTVEEAKQRLLSAAAKNLGIVVVPISNLEKELLKACR
jgi:hypothetical protein